MLQWLSEQLAGGGPSKRVSFGLTSQYGTLQRCVIKNHAFAISASETKRGQGATQLGEMRNVHCKFTASFFWIHMGRMRIPEFTPVLMGLRGRFHSGSS